MSEKLCKNIKTLSDAPPTRLHSTHPVQEEEGGEVGCVEGVEEVDKLGTVHGIGGREPAAREDAELEELSDGPVLQHLYTTQKPILLTFLCFHKPVSPLASLASPYWGRTTSPSPS